MKKIFALLLSLALLLGCAAGLAEAPGDKQTFGTLRVNGEFTLKGLLPEGYQIVPYKQSEDAVICMIQSDDNTRPSLILSIAFDETYSDVMPLNDLDDAALAILERTFTDIDPYASITYDETAHGTRLLLCRTTTDTYDYLDITSIYQGYFVELVMVPGTGAAEAKLTDDQISTCIDLLSDLDFIAGIEEEGNGEAQLVNNAVDVLIRGFDAEAKTIDLTLLAPALVEDSRIESLSEGDTLLIGSENVTVETLERGEDGEVLINGLYTLTKIDGGYYTAKDMEMPVLVEFGNLTVSVPDSVVFIEGIEPEYGEPLDEPVTLTAADLFSALAAAQNGGIGFDTQNVTVTFDENGELAQVRREHTPWQ